MEGLKVVLQQAAEWERLYSQRISEKKGSEVQLAQVAIQRYIYHKQEISPWH